jgi:hypothetical protein
MLRGFEIKFFDPVSFGDGDTGFFPVPRVDQHTHGHLKHSGRAALPQWVGTARL